MSGQTKHELYALCSGKKVVVHLHMRVCVQVRVLEFFSHMQELIDQKASNGQYMWANDLHITIN